MESELYAVTLREAEAFGVVREAIAERDLKGIYRAGGSPMFPKNSRVLEYVYRVMGWTWRDLRDMNDVAAFANDLDWHHFPSDKEELDVPLALVPEYEDWLRFLLSLLWAFDKPQQLYDECKERYDVIMLSPLGFRHLRTGLEALRMFLLDDQPGVGVHLVRSMCRISENPYAPHDVIASLWYAIPHKHGITLQDFERWAYLDLKLRADKWMADRWERKA